MFVTESRCSNIGIDWLSSIALDHTDKIGKNVIALGGGNTAMDCCRTSRRMGGEDVKVIVRSPFADMKAWPIMSRFRWWKFCLAIILGLVALLVVPITMTSRPATDDPYPAFMLLIIGGYRSVTACVGMLTSLLHRG